MKPAWNRSRCSNVVRVMETGEGTREEWAEEGPLTKRCVYVQDRDSKRWSASTEASEAAASAEQLG